MIKEANEFIEKLNKTIREKNVKDLDMFEASLILWDAWKLAGHKNPSGTLDYLHGDIREYILDAFSAEIRKHIDKRPKTVISNKVKEYFGDYTNTDHKKFQALKKNLKGIRAQEWRW